MTTPIDTSLIPAGVRVQGTRAQALYSTALQFEQLLTQQLAQGLTDSTTSPDDASSDDGDDTTMGSTSDGLGALQGMLPDALSQSVTNSGGMGLAMDLYRAMGGKEARQ